MQHEYNSEVQNQLLEMIQVAMKDEIQDYKTYKTMLSMTADKDIKENVVIMLEDEEKHYKSLQSIYEDLCGLRPEIANIEATKPVRLSAAVRGCLRSELQAVRDYRQIRSLLRGKRHRDMLLEIITDEQDHATRLVYIYTKLK